MLTNISYCANMNYMSNRLRPGHNRYIKPLTVAVVAALGLSACSAATKDYGLRDPSLTCITIGDGATIRSQPYVPSRSSEPNGMVTIKLVDSENYDIPTQDLRVTDPRGMYTSYDNNGKWFGISADVLKRSFKDPSTANDIASDPDNIVWVNEQLAGPCITNKPSSTFNATPGSTS